MNNFKGLMKQKTLGGGLQAKPALGMSSFMNQPTAPTSLPAAPSGLLKKKKPALAEVKVPNLMKRLTGK
jgi:hypothetical protein